MAQAYDVAWFRQLSFTAWPITEQAARIIVLKMFFKTPLAFAVVAAISASVMTLLGGVVALGVYRGLVHFAVLPSISHFSVSSPGVLVLAVFALALPIETVYARRTLFSRDRPSSAKPAFLLFPVAVAVAICSRLIDWRQGSE